MAPALHADSKRTGHTGGTQYQHNWSVALLSSVANDAVLGMPVVPLGVVKFVIALGPKLDLHRSIDAQVNTHGIKVSGLRFNCSWSKA